MILSNISGYINQEGQTATTVASQQYYSYPPGIVSTDNVTVTIGSVKYTLSPIYDQITWNQLNSLTIQPSAIPQFYFPRQDDFGLWPIPSASTYTITFYAFMRDRNLQVDDYTGGSATLVNGSAALAGTSSTWTAGMVGRWFEVTDTSAAGHGYWYRVSAFTSTVSMTLNMPWKDTGATTVTYRIGESPELPEEAHILLPQGTAADFYSGMRNDNKTGQEWENLFWTGSRTNSSRDIHESKISGGLIGLVNNYESRDRRRLIYKNTSPMSPLSKIWATTLS